MQTDTERRVTRLIIVICIIFFGIFVVLPQVFEVLVGRDSMARSPNMRSLPWVVKEVPPASGEFNAVKLSGNYTATTSQYETGQSGNFEIIMHGADAYFRHQWHKGLSGGSYMTELLLTNIYCDRTARVGPFGSGGGGGSGSVEHRIFPARRLWKGNTFVGVSNENEPATIGDRHFSETEEFRDLKKVGTFTIPGEIIYSNRNHQVLTYSIDKIEFANEAKPNFFFEIRDKYFRGRFDQLAQMLQTNKPTLATPTP